MVLVGRTLLATLRTRLTRPKGKGRVLSKLLIFPSPLDCQSLQPRGQFFSLLRRWGCQRLLFTP
ncbi:hypothetical protein RSAG8_00545, partial [Rhizoctonia solani AG-8 WAC10335]